MYYINAQNRLIVKAALYSCLLAAFNAYSMQAPLLDTVIQISPENAKNVLPQSQSLTRSSSHHTFHSVRVTRHKHRGRNLLLAPDIINNTGVSINTVPQISQPKKGGCMNTMHKAREWFHFAMAATTLYMVYQLVNKAEQIAGNTESLNEEGKVIESGVATIAGGVTLVENIAGYLWNLTRSGW